MNDATGHVRHRGDCARGDLRFRNTGADGNRERRDVQAGSVAPAWVLPAACAVTTARPLGWSRWTQALGSSMDHATVEVAVALTGLSTARGWRSGRVRWPQLTIRASAKVTPTHNGTTYAVFVDPALPTLFRELRGKAGRLWCQFHHARERDLAAELAQRVLVQPETGHDEPSDSNFYGQ